MDRAPPRSGLDRVPFKAAHVPRCHVELDVILELEVMDKNETLFERAKALIPGGVNSPVRAFRAVGGTPRFVQRAQGAHFWDADGRRYIDYIGSWGPMILGHGHPAVVEAVQRAVLEGFSYGAPTEREVELAEEIVSLVPSIEMVRLVSSGTEAAMSAIRLARGATGRSKLIKFEGCYHGHADALLVKAGSGLATFGNPTSAGVPPEVVQHTLVLEYNNLAQLEEVFALHGADIACLMIEPIAGNMNFVRAGVPFMRRCRELCTQHGALLVFDEVMTGFRVALGGAQSVYAGAIGGFRPDLSVLGKVIGGGMPLAAFGGPRAIMEQLAPLGPVYQAGTLSGNPVATACGLATLREIRKPGFFDALAARTAMLVEGLKSAAMGEGVAFSADCEGGMFGFFLLPDLPQNYSQVMRSDSPRFNLLFHGLLDRGVYIAPALYEAGFVSAAHSEADIAETIAAAREVFRTLA
jgi:glutamate-1-semialdehyde 2,1-aminomutase